MVTTRMLEQSHHCMKQAQAIGLGHQTGTQSCEPRAGATGIPLAVNPNASDLHLVPTKRILSGLVLGAAVAALGACHVPPPVTRSVLRITATGDITLDGEVLAPVELVAALKARKLARSELEVEVRASPDADMSRVQAVIESTKLAHVRVSFAREDGTP